MTSETKPALKAHLIMPLGADTAPASALAHATGTLLHSYDRAALAAALAQGQTCIVVWSDPATALAEAMRSQVAPSDAALGWRQSAQDLLALFARNRRRLLLIEAALIMQGTQADHARLQARLGLTEPLPRPEPGPADLPALLAPLVTAQLTDLRPVWEELQASSLSTPPQTHASTDLDAVARLLASQMSAQTSLQEQLSTATRLHQSEAELQRATMADLSQALLQAADLQDQLQAKAKTDAQRLTTLDQETHLLRDQLTDLSGQTTAHHLHQQSAQAAERAQQAEHAKLQRDHDRTQLELTLVREQLQAVSALMTSPPTVGAGEAGLLRDQLVNVTALVREPAKPSQQGLGPAHIQIEAAFATLLQALVTETDLRQQAEAALPRRN